MFEATGPASHCSSVTVGEGIFGDGVIVVAKPVEDEEEEEESHEEVAVEFCAGEDVLEDEIFVVAAPVEEEEEEEDYEEYDDQESEDEGSDYEEYNDEVAYEEEVGENSFEVVPALEEDDESIVGIFDDFDGVFVIGDDEEEEYDGEDAELAAPVVVKAEETLDDDILVISIPDENSSQAGSISILPGAGDLVTTAPISSAEEASSSPARPESPTGICSGLESTLVNFFRATLSVLAEYLIPVIEPPTTTPNHTTTPTPAIPAPPAAPTYSEQRFIPKRKSPLANEVKLEDIKFPHTRKEVLAARGKWRRNVVRLVRKKDVERPVHKRMLRWRYTLAVSQAALDA